MKKLKKILITAIVIIIALLIIGGIAVALCLDGIAKKGIEEVAPTITKTAVTLDSIHISPLSGSVSINHLIVANPDGFSSASNAISVGKAAVSVAPKSLLADKIVIHSVEVRAPEITFVGNPFGDNNLQKLLDNVSGTPSTNTPATPPSTTKKAAKKLEVDDFLISGATVTARVTGMEGEPFSVTIPDIHFSNLGTGPDGITAADLTKKVLTEIISGSISAVGTHAKQILGKGADTLLKGASGTAGKAIGSGTDQLKKGIGNLLGK